ncbi:hypothetical protein [Rugamonas aquatica]|uniref:Uncharacterized protein n=1 Tax=Rugamonas aquatica TaxID=2743357 RepID=A0A6A7ND99_9BURK|nr:hypothetical protein [Rugamonas aquatica]MQA42347.1 hypothetical protein [Rugamonas aquatica]
MAIQTARMRLANPTMYLMNNYHISYKSFEIRSFSSQNEQDKWQGRWELYRQLSRIDSSTVVTEFATSTDASQNALAVCCQMVDEGRIRNPALLATGF